MWQLSGQPGSCCTDVATGAVGGGLDGRGGRGGRTVPRQRHLTETWLTPDDDLIFQSSVKMP